MYYKTNTNPNIDRKVMHHYFSTGFLYHHCRSSPRWVPLSPPNVSRPSASLLEGHDKITWRWSGKSMDKTRCSIHTHIKCI